tara:strand:+ start:13604 stop:13960 length:357 start_codon:yes stop_codon:yes gene_type:complete
MSYLIPKFSNFFDNNFLFDDFSGFRESKIDIRENSSSFVVQVPLAGFTKENVDIDLEGNILKIRAENRKKENFYSFKRSLSLGSNIDAENISAEMKDGMLTVIIPKKEIKESKKITIN